jgi:hypothetical protein
MTVSSNLDFFLKYLLSPVIIIISALYYKFIYLIKKDVELEKNTKSLQTLNLDILNLTIKYDNIINDNSKTQHIYQIENININNKLGVIMANQEMVTHQLFILIEKQEKRLEKLEEIIIYNKNDKNQFN